MTKPLTMLATLLLAGTVAFAQGGTGSSTDPTGHPGMSSAPAGQSDTSSSSDTKKDENKDENKVRGCLSGSEGNYMLMSAAGMTYRLQGKEDDLKDHVGHEVEVELEGPASNADSAQATGQTGGTTGAAVGGTTSSGNTGSEQSGAIAGRSDSTSAARGTTTASAKSVQVKDIEKIADSCTTTSGNGMSGSGSGSGSYGTGSAGSTGSSTDRGQGTPTTPQP